MGITTVATAFPNEKSLASFIAKMSNPRAQSVNIRSKKIMKKGLTEANNKATIAPKSSGTLA